MAKLLWFSGRKELKQDGRTEGKVNRISLSTNCNKWQVNGIFQQMNCYTSKRGVG
jgi:hypothetical protein